MTTIKMNISCNWCNYSEFIIHEIWNGKLFMFDYFLISRINTVPLYRINRIFFFNNHEYIEGLIANVTITKIFALSAKIYVIKYLVSVRY